jgi:hypothetical protein
MGQLINNSQNMIRQWLLMRWLVSEKKPKQGQASNIFYPLKLQVRCWVKAIDKRRTTGWYHLTKEKKETNIRNFWINFVPPQPSLRRPCWCALGVRADTITVPTCVRVGVMTSYILPLTSSPTPPRHINVVWRLKSCLELLHPLIGSIRGEHPSWRHKRVSYFIVQGTDMYLLIAKWPPLILCSEHTGCWQTEIKNITEYCGRGWSASYSRGRGFEYQPSENPDWRFSLFYQLHHVSFVAVSQTRS